MIRDKLLPFGAKAYTAASGGTDPAWFFGYRDDGTEVHSVVRPSRSDYERLRSETEKRRKARRIVDTVGTG